MRIPLFTQLYALFSNVLVAFIQYVMCAPPRKINVGGGRVVMSSEQFTADYTGHFVGTSSALHRAHSHGPRRIPSSLLRSRCFVLDFLSIVLLGRTIVCGPRPALALRGPRQVLVSSGRATHCLGSSLSRFPSFDSPVRNWPAVARPVDSRPPRAPEIDRDRSSLKGR